MDAGMDPGFDKATPGLSVPDPPTSAFVGQFVLVSGKIHVFHVS